MGVARLVRGEVISLREREFVKAARVIGVPTRRILVREMLPNLIAPIVVSFSLGLPAYVSAEAGLSFLGIGVFGRDSWGRTINSRHEVVGEYPQYLLAPVVGIASSSSRSTSWVMPSGTRSTPRPVARDPQTSAAHPRDRQEQKERLEHETHQGVCRQYQPRDADADPCGLRRRRRRRPRRAAEADIDKGATSAGGKNPDC